MGCHGGGGGEGKGSARGFMFGRILIFGFIFFFFSWSFQRCGGGSGCSIVRSSASQVPLWCTADRIKTLVSVYDVVFGVLCDFCDFGGPFHRVSLAPLWLTADPCLRHAPHTATHPPPPSATPDLYQRPTAIDTPSALPPSLPGPILLKHAITASNPPTQPPCRPRHRPRQQQGSPRAQR